jgi:uncharacterized membrane protein
LGRRCTVAAEVTCADAGVRHDAGMTSSMNVILWVVQAVLAVMFAISGLMKAIRPKAKLIDKYPWMLSFSQATVRFIGVMELLGAIGLIVPAASKVAPILTPIAGTSLAVMMILAATLHIRRRELSGVAFTATLFVLTALLALARFGSYGW